MASNPQFVNTAFTKAQKFVNADGTTQKTLCTIGANGGAIDSLFLTSTDTTSRNVKVTLTTGGVEAVLDVVTVPAATASRPVQHVNLLDPNRWTWLDPNQIRWVIAGTSVLKVNAETAVAATFEINAVVNYGEF